MVSPSQRGRPNQYIKRIAGNITPDAKRSSQHLFSFFLSSFQTEKNTMSRFFFFCRLIRVLTDFDSKISSEIVKPLLLVCCVPLIFNLDGGISVKLRRVHNVQHSDCLVPPPPPPPPHGPAWGVKSIPANNISRKILCVRMYICT